MLVTLALLAASANAFVLTARPAAQLTTPRVAAVPQMQLFGLGKPKKTAEEILEEQR